MTVQTRNVFYFCGFDPRGCAHYSRLFRTELRKYGFAIVGHADNPTTMPDKLCRRLRAANAEAATSRGTSHIGETKLNLFLMKWDDIVRHHWPTSVWSLLIAGWGVYRTGLANISLKKVWEISRGAFWAGVLPLLVIAIALAWLALVFSLARTLFDASLPPALTRSDFPSIALAAGVVILAARALPPAIEKTGAFWLIRIFRFNLLLATNELPEIRQRQQAWVESIIQQQRENPSDEVVLLGHSVGTIVMMEVAKKLMNDPRWQALNGGRPTKMLTLGNCIPFVSLHPSAASFRKTLCKLGQCDDIEWWDITAKVDPLCFYLSSPLGERGKQNAVNGKPVLRAARFFRMYTPQTWQTLRHDKLQLHFLYLAMPEIDCDFNLYRLICGSHPVEVPMNGASNV